MRRAAAIVSLAAAAAAVAVAVAVIVEEFPRGLVVVGCVVAAVVGVAMAAIHRGSLRTIGFALGTAGLLATIALVATSDRLPENVGLLALAAISIVAARRAFVVHAELTPVPAPSHPVLIFNPLSGDGTATEVHLADEARARGIEAVELRRGDDLRRLVQAAADDGADALAMAGGDGSQAIVAAMAAKLGLPFACIPAGTRNHFALDLGVDREDVVGALDALVDGGERLVDLAEVNGRVFVNNVSLGLYAEAVQRSGYREAKIRTILEVLPEALAEEDGSSQMSWTGPDGEAHQAAAAMLVSNNPYRLGRAIGSGTRPRIDGGVLGVLVAGQPRQSGGGESSELRGRDRAWQEWSTPSLEVGAAGPIPAGIDGEAAMLQPPLLFRSMPNALRVRIARHHPGISPSAAAPSGLVDAARTLARMAFDGSEPTR